MSSKNTVNYVVYYEEPIGKSDVYAFIELITVKELGFQSLVCKAMMLS